MLGKEAGGKMGPVPSLRWLAQRLLWLKAEGGNKGALCRDGVPQ